MSAPPNHASDALNDADFDLQGVHDAADVARLATRLYGDAPLDAEGVLHVTAIDGNSGRTLRIDDHAPKSHADAFALNLARARADAIVITGKILRDEPKLSYAPGAPGPTTPAFTAFRAALGRTSRPLLVVMTRGANLPLEHPVFHGGDVRALIYGPESGVAALRAQTNADVVGTPGEARLSDL
jgi:riboflavin biosynthesis pyrimidine reductase